MKYELMVDEKWPVYSLEKSCGYDEVEISDEDYEEYVSVMNKYNLLQSKLGLMYDKQRTEREECIRKDLYPKSIANGTYS